ncbi:uncharacterized protein PGTG_04758 [Puccinia graminis f. sp. tritici CRL 75-36-700-3]|uniref:Uncharacterized protein n=1 Tax=Puccinia graminis f. sp. tritici (strain CRL 75-36-700-3 / race SCCL) TaxID=418459 RepID=E3K400_PUCGT|nr:uncharacterized protein PGTG_04758 [Puccinia graminis f. sp. tritici CRL 75-36-700-3]EFP78802.2 hypothetical protein PGTG_04758 [Puccinia graminis f. sp. tritici CRL 75-36-700-3]
MADGPNSQDPVAPGPNNSLVNLNKAPGPESQESVSSSDHSLPVSLVKAQNEENQYHNWSYAYHEDLQNLLSLIAQKSELPVSDAHNKESAEEDLSEILDFSEEEISAILDKGLLELLDYSSI